MDARERMERTARAGGASIAAALRADGVAESLASRSRRTRQRRTALQSVAALVVALAATFGAARVLPAIIDNEPATVTTTHVGDVAPIDPGAPGWFMCGETPSAVPQQGVTVPTTGAAPSLETMVVTRTGGDLGTAVTALRLDGDVVDPRDALVFAVGVAWGEQAPPDGWRVTAAGALLDAEGRVVGLSRGELSRSDIAPIVEGLRPLEGAIDPLACGVEPGTLDGEHTLALVVQVRAPDEAASSGAVVATFVDYGLPAPPTVRFAADGGARPTGAADAARADHLRQVRAVTAEGVGLGEARIGYRPSAVSADADAPFRSCAAVALAREGISAVSVIPWPTMPAGLEVGMAPPFDDPTERALAFSFPSDPGDFSWARSRRESTLLLFAASGELVAALESPPLGWIIEGGGTTIVLRAYSRGTECAVSGEVPTEPGTYTPVLSLVPSELPGAASEPLPLANDHYPIELWVVLPDVEVAADGTIADLPWLADAMDAWN